MTQIDSDQFQTVLNSSMNRYETEDVLTLVDEIVSGAENDPVRTVEGAKTLAAAYILRERLEG